MDKKKYQIFISSTYKDLEEARKKIQETILSMYQFPIGMEMFSADDDEQWEVIKETIDSSDYYVVIIGHRYGSETAEGISYTEKEYDYAKEKEIPVLAFIRERNIALKEEERENQSDKIDKLNAFIEKATGNKMCDFWATIDELALKVSIALNKQFNKRQRPGWIRADNVDFTQISNEITQLSKENRKLREENMDLKSKLEIKKPIINLHINDGEELKIKYNKKYDKVMNKIGPIEFETIPAHLKRYITQEEVDEYNEGLPPEEEISRYLNEKKLYLRMKNTGKDIELKVSNDGVVKANNIYIDIEFPEEFKIVETEEIENLQEPKELSLPTNPIKKAEKEYGRRYSPVPSGISTFLSPNILKMGMDDRIYRPLLNRRRDSCLEKNKIIIKIDSLIYTRQISIDEKYRIIPLSVGEFEMNISIICEEYEGKYQYTLPILVEATEF